MKNKLGLTVLTVACIGLASCMTGNNDSAQADANRKTLDFANSASAALTKTTFNVEGQGQVDIAALMRSAGVCEPFITLVEDMANCGNGSCDEGLPQSVVKFVSCFGIKLDGNGSIEDIDSISAAVQNFAQFESCVCGGSGTLFGSYSYDDLKWQAFSASASAAAGAAFTASSSSAGGTAFSGSQSTAVGGAFNGSQSNATGQPFNPSK